MKKYIAVFVFLSAYALADRPSCVPYNDVKKYYFGSDGQILYPPNVGIDNHLMSPEEGKYMRRLLSEIRSRGTNVLLVAVPTPGFTLEGKLDALSIKDTLFSQVNSVGYALKALQSYNVRAKSWMDSGATVVNIMQPLFDEHINNPNNQLYFKQDDHWTPNAAQISAKSVAIAVKQYFPDVINSFTPISFKVENEESRINEGWSAIIKQGCPDSNWVSLDEKYNSPKIQSQGLGLLDSNISPIVLVGSSFTAKKRNYGFSDYLSSILRTEIQNYSLEAGGTFGALREYYSIRGNDAIEPKLLIWEFPIESAYFDIMYFRQIIPLVSSNSKKINEYRIGDLSQQRSVKIDKNNIGNGQYYLKISFEKYISRSLCIKINGKEGGEEDNLTQKYGTPPKSWYIELNTTSNLQNISFALPEDASGGVDIELYEYKKL